MNLIIDNNESKLPWPTSSKVTLNKYNKNVRWLKTFKKNTSFRLSIYSFRRIKMDAKLDKIYAKKAR